MIQAVIPGYGTMNLEVLVLDYNGTLALDGQMFKSVKVKVLESTEHVKEKADYVLQFGTREVVAIGNGANDQFMLQHARLGIAVIGFEGASTQALLSADLIVHKIEDAFGLLLETQRLKATLRL